MRWCLNRWRGRAALLVVLSALAGPALAGPDDGIKDGAAKPDQKIPEIEDAGKRIMEGKIEDAYKLLQEACKKKPELPPARLMLARLMLASQIRELGPRIRPVLELAISENAEHPVCYLENANLALNEGRVTDAMLNAERALQLGAGARWTPDQKKDVELGGHTVLARAYEARADWAGAKAHLQALLGKDDKNGTLRVQLAKVMFLLLKMPEDMNKTSDVYSELKKAYDDEKKAHADDPKVLPPDVNMGKFWADKGDSPEAEKAFEKAVKADPQNFKVLVAYADWLMQKNRYADAKARVEAAAKLKPEDMAKLKPEELDVPRFQGLVARVLKDYDGAAKVFKQILSIAPDDTFARNHLALVLIDQGGKAQQDQAIAYAELNAKANPKSPEAYATLGYVYFKAKRTAEAEQALQAAVQASNNRGLSPDTAYYFALVLNERGKQDEAIKILKEAISASGLFVYQKEAKDLKEKLDRHLSSR